MGDQYRSISGGHDDSDDNSRRRPAFFFPGVRSVSYEMAQDYLHRVCLYFTVYGVAFLIVGVLCILLPIIFTGISIQHLVAWILIIGGAASLLHFLLVFGAPGTTSFLLLGLVHLAVGLWILFQKSVRRGSAFVWLLFGWFFIHGVLKMLMGYEVRSLKSWPMLAGSGTIAIILAILNVALAGAYGFQVVCILFGIDLAITGIAFLLVSGMAYYANRSADHNPLLGDA
ncbi:hypothetical protein GOP47_0011832 [Adiantum capillus-veneris]|uniref:HdeD family acid-resistance protein n=1 Tax=Adiantum capillus-veneris TaxID=13818 RepID=A0A9D4UTH9_ADICA|nr:hypothetical protein GOP47_0011832 [Adiantum capillus-veneris]